MSEARLNVRRLVSVLLLGVVLPICAALLIDFSLGTLPIATIAALVIFLPLGAIWLSRVSLSELDRVIAEVAPDNAISDDLGGDSSANPPAGSPG